MRKYLTPITLEDAGAHQTIYSDRKAWVTEPWPLTISMCRVCAFDVGSALVIKASYCLLLSLQNAIPTPSWCQHYRSTQKGSCTSTSKATWSCTGQWRGQEVTTASRPSRLDGPTNGRWCIATRHVAGERYTLPMRLIHCTYIYLRGISRKIKKVPDFRKVLSGG